MKARAGFFLLMLVAGAALAPPWAGRAAAQESDTSRRVVLEEIVARVNNEIITLAEYDRSKQLLRKELTEKYSGAELEQKYGQGATDVLRDLIDQSLLVQRALEMGASVEPDVIKRLDRIRQEMGLKTMEDLERAMAERGTNLEDYRLHLRNQLLTQWVIQREVSSHVLLDEDEVRQYYLQHREEFDQPERVHLREILISTENVRPEDLPAREARVQEVLKKIRRGQKFEEVAKQYSDAPTAEDGGDLGYFEPAKLAASLRDVISKLLEGGVSDPIRTSQGWLILQKVEDLPAGIPPFEKVQGDIREKLYFSHIEPALRDYLSNLRRDSYVYVKPGYLDSGAVPQEDKPLRRSRRRHARKS